MALFGNPSVVFCTWYVGIVAASVVAGFVARRARGELEGLLWRACRQTIRRDTGTGATGKVAAVAVAAAAGAAAAAAAAVVNVAVAVVDVVVAAAVAVACVLLRWLLRFSSKSDSSEQVSSPFL